MRREAWASSHLLCGRDPDDMETGTQQALVARARLAILGSAMQQGY